MVMREINQKFHKHTTHPEELVWFSYDSQGLI